jgi:hypothetical protein
MITESRRYTLYRPLEGGIHEIVVRKPSRQAVDELFDYFNEIHASAASGEVVRFLVSHVNGAIPLNYAMERTRQDHHKWTHPSRTAHLSDSGSLVYIAARLFSTVRQPNSKIRYFPASERDQAVAWLLREG